MVLILSDVFFQGKTWVLSDCKCKKTAELGMAFTGTTGKRITGEVVYSRNQRLVLKSPANVPSESVMLDFDGIHLAMGKLFRHIIIGYIFNAVHI